MPDTPTITKLSLSKEDKFFSDDRKNWRARALNFKQPVFL